jgi:hypothetical protein
MTALVQTLLHNPAAAMHCALTWQVRLQRVRLLMAGLVGAMTWGAAMGSHVGRAHLWITTLKMPLMLLGTLALCFPLMHLVALIARLPLRAHETLTIALGGLAVFATVLGALAPVLALFAATAPIPSMASYLNLYLFCAICGLGAGLFALRAMAHGLRAAAPGLRTRGVLVAWAVVFQFTGAQAAWVLRPWIGSSYGVEGYWNLQRGLSGNFYLGVGRVFLRWLAEIGVLP